MSFSGYYIVITLLFKPFGYSISYNINFISYNIQNSLINLCILSLYKPYDTKSINRKAYKPAITPILMETNVNPSTCKRFLRESETRSTKQATITLQKTIRLLILEVVKQAKANSELRGSKTIGSEDIVSVKSVTITI